MSCKGQLDRPHLCRLCGLRLSVKCDSCEVRFFQVFSNALRFRMSLRPSFTDLHFYFDMDHISQMKFQRFFGFPMLLLCTQAPHHCTHLRMIFEIQQRDRFLSPRDFNMFRPTRTLLHTCNRQNHHIMIIITSWTIIPLKFAAPYEQDVGWG